MRRTVVSSCTRAFRRGYSTRARTPRDAVIVGAARTPIASFNGAFKSLRAPDLGAAAIGGALDKAGVAGTEMNEVIFGNVLSAGIGQAPARQAAVKAGVSLEAGATTINKVCSSGLKSLMYASQSVMLGQSNAVVCGGMESMSQVPLYAPKATTPYGNVTLSDGLLKDGLWDAFDDHHMGSCAERIATEMKLSREDQDAFALESYRRVADSTEKGLFRDEIAPVTVPGGRGRDDVVVDTDEEFRRLNPDKMSSLRPAFGKDGTVTAANASSLNDGAAAMVVVSREFAEERGLRPLARVIGMADAAQEPVYFTTAPAKAMPIAIRNAGIQQSDVDFWEINEAFSAVALANNQILGLDPDTVNVNGGAVGLGHPIGCSGARIVVTLLSVLQQRDATIGVAGICNGGGGASAIVVERE